MEEIKAIETEYNGYRFRSRLEARWAVFFDACGIEYVYEPEGFELGNGLRYLPDFYLPNDDVWIEIKGKKLSDAEREKIIQFCKLKCDVKNGGSRFRLLEGNIPKEPIMIKDVPSIPFFCCVPIKDLPDVDSEDDSLVFVLGLWTRCWNYEDVKFGLLKARQARFEHGEKPII